jgi:hypothetical protein
VVENLPPEPQRAIKIPLQPKNVVENQPLLTLGVVENQPLVGLLLRKSKKVVEIEAVLLFSRLKLDLDCGCIPRSLPGSAP